MQVDDVVALVFELRLHEEAQEVRVPAVAVHDEDLLEAVAGDLGARRVEQVPDQPRRQRKRARLVPGLVDLPVEVVREDDGVFLLHGTSDQVARLNEIRANRRVRSVLLENADGQNGRLVRLLESLGPVARGEVVHTGGQVLSRRRCGNEQQQAENGKAHDGTSGPEGWTPQAIRAGSEGEMVRGPRLELCAFRLGGVCSIDLSYTRTAGCKP